MNILKSTELLSSLIEEHLKHFISPPQGKEAPLFEAALYSLLLPSKRLRPKLLLSVLQDCQIPIEKGLDVACALEMIHTYALIHDDLPSMDNASLRRGKPTLHTIYGEGHAILTGDFLLTKAFEILAPKQTLVTLFAQRCGGKGLIGGQVIDLLYEGFPIDWETLYAMYLGKTGSLFSTALESGAIIAQLNTTMRLNLKKAGELFGVAFQIWDDILDATSDEKTLGKPTLSDQTNRKATCLTLFSKEEAQSKAQDYLESAHRMLPSSFIQTKALLKL